jgi:hypothetical protein
VPGMLSPMDFYAVSQVWRLVPALGLVREVRHAAQMTAIRSNRMLPVTTVLFLPLRAKVELLRFRTVQ